MLIVLTEKKKTDFAHMLVLKRMLVPIKMLTVHMFAPCHHGPNMPETQPLDLDDGLSCGENVLNICM